MEAPSGIEPLNRSFADCSLNHLGTAPSLIIIRSRFWSTQLGRSLAVEEKYTKTSDNNYLRGNTGISREEGPVEAKDNSAIEGATGLAG